MARLKRFIGAHTHERTYGVLTGVGGLSGL